MSLPLGRFRKVVLEVAAWSADRLAIAEIAYFKRSLLAKRTGLARDLARAEEARVKANWFADSLADDLADLFTCGLSATGIEIAERAAARIESARELIAAAEAHAGRDVPDIAPACGESAPWVAKKGGVA